MSVLGWPNLLLRDKLPTGNEQGSAGMPTVGNGAYTYEPVENWAKLPPGWSFKEIGGVGVDRHDNVFVFNRGEHPMIVFDCDGNFLRSFGEGMFPRAHGVFMALDDTIWLTDDGDHTVRQCTLEGKVLLTLGISGKPAPFMSGEPFHRCTHTAMSPQGDIYVSDGYGNSRVHKYAPNGKLLLSWGGPGTDPGEFNIAHNLTCDADGWVYVADRENHRVQVFDGNGKYETPAHSCRSRWVTISMRLGYRSSRTLPSISAAWAPATRISTMTLQSAWGTRRRQFGSKMLSSSAARRRR